MLNFSKFILCILPLTVSCQAEPLGSLIFFRAEVEEGSKGAIACDYLENANGTVWFGPLHPYTLQHAEPTIGHGGTPVVAFEIVDDEKESFSDFTEEEVRAIVAVLHEGNTW